MLVSVEHEMPVIAGDGAKSVPPEVFTELWSSLARSGWERDGSFAVTRAVPFAHSSAKKPAQTITTDTGPTIEMSPTPCERIRDIETQLQELRSVVKRELHPAGLSLLGIGVHPVLGTTDADYQHYRTPRSAYDYATQIRGWNHQSILNIAALQEVINIPVAKAPAIVSVMHRLAGLMLFLFRNDPAFVKDGAGLLSVRPQAWRDHITARSRFQSDAAKMYLPAKKIEDWESYLRLLWSQNPMFLLGTKDSGLVYVPEHPSFEQFMTAPPKGGWEARRLDTGEATRIEPTMSYISQTDWTYMGFARLRIFWNEHVSLPEVTAAFAKGGAYLESFMASATDRVLLENRSSASPLPGEELCSLAFVTGIVENFEEAEQFAESISYESWLEWARTGETLPLAHSSTGDLLPTMLSTILRIAEAGLAQRGFTEEEYLAPLWRKVHDRFSSSERLLDLFHKNGKDAVIEAVRY